MRQFLVLVIFLACPVSAKAQYAGFYQNGPSIEQQAWQIQQRQQMQIRQIAYQRQVAQQQQVLRTQQRNAQLQALRERNRQLALAKQQQEELQQREAEHQKRLATDPEYAKQFRQQQELQSKVAAGLAGLAVGFLSNLADDTSQTYSQEAMDDYRRSEIWRHRAEQELNHAEAEAARNAYR